MLTVWAEVDALWIVDRGKRRRPCDFITAEGLLHLTSVVDKPSARALHAWALARLGRAAVEPVEVAAEADAAPPASAPQSTVSGGGSSAESTAEPNRGDQTQSGRQELERQ